MQKFYCLKNKTREIIILETDDRVRVKAEATLTKAGDRVRCETSPAAVLAILEKEKSSCVFLVICGCGISQQDSENILKEIEDVSVLTQKLLLISSNEPERLIHAINTTKINSCLSFPFQDKDLINRVEDCCKKFDMLIEQARLKQETMQQNQKMFKMAQSFKELERNNTAIIEEKKKIIQKLKVHLKSDVKKPSQETSILEDLIKTGNLPRTREVYSDEFNEILSHSICLKKAVEKAPLPRPGFL